MRTPSLTKQRIKRVFDGAANNIAQGREPNIKNEMIKQGYTEKSATAMKVIFTKTWEELLKDKFPDDRVQNLLDKALSEYEDEPKIKDMRSFLGLMDMILKLKDKYPK
jgi:hypothetical protein